MATGPSETTARTSLTPDIDFSLAVSCYEQPAEPSCNCRKSRCLKLYCECFANGKYCQGCKCKFCNNKPDYEAKRRKAIQIVIEKNPEAFAAVDSLRQVKLKVPPKGCNCKKSQCQKKYCECFLNGVLCSANCHCSDCRNCAETVQSEESLPAKRPVAS